MRPRSHALFPIALLSLLALAACGPGTDERPNIVLILADDLGYETLGANGGTSWSTPNLDALAASGMRFTQAFATPLCTPSRVQLMTGKYGHRNYVGFGILRRGETTFAHVLREEGYRTAIVGKWQLYGNQRQHDLAGQVGTRPDEAGFDEHLLWQVDEGGSRYANPRLVVDGDSTRTFQGAYGPDVFARFIEGYVTRSDTAPFFLYYPMVLPHDPFLPTPLDDAYGSAANHDTRWFGSHVAYMDAVVGRIVTALEAAGKRENTLILFVGDNGTHRRIVSEIDGQSVLGHKAYPDAAGTHVPMIASWPGSVAAGQVNDNLIDLSDFLPTFAEAAESEAWESDGLSFFGQLLGRADTMRAWTFTHYAPGWGGFADARWAHDGQLKLYDDGRIFDIVRDPFELRPLSADSLSEEQSAAIPKLLDVLTRFQ